MYLNKENNSAVYTQVVYIQVNLLKFLMSSRNFQLDQFVTNSRIFEESWMSSNRKFFHLEPMCMWQIHGHPATVMCTNIDLT